jgi:Chaperone of endosialidase/Domain of unknown function (DUF5011)
LFGAHHPVAYTPQPNPPPSALAAAAASAVSQPQPVVAANSSPSATTTSVNNYITEPVERVVEYAPLAGTGYVTQTSLTSQLQQLSNALVAQLTPTKSLVLPAYVASDGNPIVPYAGANAGVNFSDLTVGDIPNLSGEYLSLGGGTLTGTLNSSSTATTTFAAGMNILSGCFSVDGTCVGVSSGSGTIGSGTQGQFAFYNAAGTTLSATSSLFLSQSGNVGIGTTSPSYALDVTSSGQLGEFTDGNGNSVEINRSAGDLLETHATSATGLTMYVNNNNANGAPPLTMYKSRGTGSDPSAVQWCGSYECGDYLGYINFGGYDGSSYGLGAAIYASVDQNWTPTAHGSHLAIYFTRLGATTQNEMVQFGGKDASNVDGNDALFYWPLNFFSNSGTGVQLSGNGAGGLDMYRGDGSAGANFDVLGSIGVGTTSPESVLSVSNTVSTAANTPLFTIASTTAGTATSTLLTVLPSGNVGIGTASPTSTVDVRSSDGNAVQLGLNPIDGDGYAINIVRSNSFLRFAGFNLGYINFGGTADGYNSEQVGAYINSQTELSGSSNSWQSVPAANLIFATTPTLSSPGSASPVERLYIDDNGNVGIGTLIAGTAPGAKLYVNADNGDTNSTVFVVASSTANATTTLFSVANTGNATLAGTLTQNSDQRLKTDIQSLDSSSSLAAIDSLNPVTFNWIDNMFGSGDQLGFLAQQVQTIFPQLVSTTSPTALTPGGTLGLNYTGLISPIVSAIQELDQQLTNLANTVAGFANSFTTNQLTFVRATGQELCLQQSDGTPVCVTGDQLAALLANADASQSSGQGSGTTQSDDSQVTDTPPIIEINGDNPAIIQVGATYNDLGATITGPQQDLNLGINTFVNGVPMSPVEIDTSATATDTIDYVATDQNGLTSTSTRTVIIEAPANDNQATSTPANDNTPPPTSSATSTATPTSS